MFSRLSCVYKTVADCDIQADLYRLPGDEIRPVILWLHGGALILGSRDALSKDQLERYLQAGYAVVAVDYRLAPEVKLEAIIEDLQDAYRWIYTRGPDLLRVDPERIAVIGHSAGGYLTLMAGFCVTPRPRALVSFYGYGDITGSWYSEPDLFYNQQPAVTVEEAYQAVGHSVLTSASFSEPLGETRYRFYLYCRQQGRWPLEVSGHDPKEEPRWFDAFCPVRNVTKEYPPTMLIHGDQDTDVPFEQSVLMAKALAEQQVEHEFVRMLNRGHGFDGKGMEDPEISRLFDRVLAFLEKQGMQQRS